MRIWPIDLDARRNAQMGVKVRGSKAICISAANKAAGEEIEISRRICREVFGVLAEEEISCKILELKKFEPVPCTGCGRCSDIRRCGRDKDFNRIYEELLGAEYLFVISPYYAPIPAKLCMVLEKMKQIAFCYSQREGKCQPELQGKLAGVISYGIGGGNGARNHKMMVNDTIANGFSSVMVKVVPYNSKWDTGIFLPVEMLRDQSLQAAGLRTALGTDWTVQEYGWEEEIRKYVEVTIQTAKSLYAIL